MNKIKRIIQEFLQYLYKEIGVLDEDLKLKISYKSLNDEISYFFEVGDPEPILNKLINDNIFTDQMDGYYQLELNIKVMEED